MPPFHRKRPFGKRRTKPPPAASTMQPVQPTPIVDTGGGSGRSGGKLAAPTHNAAVSTGLHFGHHKADSPAPAEQAGLAAQFNRQQLSSSGSPNGAPGMASNDLLTYFPPLDTFQSNTMDIYPSNGTPPPPGGSARTANVNILITGVFPEGTRSRGQGGFDYTHIIVCDAFVEVHDSYVGNTQALSANGDILRIPSGVANYWVAVFVFVTQLPGVGRKKVVLADRRGGVGDYTKIL
jgi:hypothetical protein